MSLPEPLITLLRHASPLALAFSGGLDSRFLAHAAQAADVRIKLFHIRGAHVPEEESAEAEVWARERALPLTVLEQNPLYVPEVRANGRERCYHCKHHLFSALQRSLCDDLFFAGNTPTLCDGSNASDSLTYRPGLRALAELGVRAPLAEAGLGKDDIRRLGAASGLDRPEQQARPCLLTRFAYGISPDSRSLAGLDAAEREIAAILEQGPEAPSPRLTPSLPPPDFRLRVVAPLADSIASLPFVLELHIAAALSRTQEMAVARAVGRHGFAPPRIIVMETVSGHYDRTP